MAMPEVALPPPCGSPPAPCTGFDPDPNCPDQAYTDIFANVPVFMNTADMQNFVCSLTGADRARLRDDVLAHQGELWGVTEQQYAAFTTWRGQEVWAILADLDLDSGACASKCYRVFFNALLYQLWFDYYIP